MTNLLLLLLVTLSVAARAQANNSSCGPDRPSKVPGCDHPDMGSCGNACCVVNLELPFGVDDVYNTSVAVLKSGGPDGSFTHVVGPNAAGVDPSDDLRPYGIPWSYVFQGSHVTTGGFYDNIDINLSPLPGKAGLNAAAGNPGNTAIRMSFRAGIHGALGDNGQSYKTLQYFAEACLAQFKARGLGLDDPAAYPIVPVFGCGMK